MANPVVLDLSAAKTLFAFGERAAKHGLAVPGDLQQFIDEPNKMVRLVKYVKDGAPFYRVMLPDINWPETYKALGMEDEWSAVKDLVLPERSDLWVMPMARGVTSNKIVIGHRKLAVKFCLYREDLDREVPMHDRDPKRDGSYLVGFRRSIEADEEKEGDKGSTLPERFLLGAGFYVTTGQHLDIAKWTKCTGSRYRDGGVPIVYWSSYNRRVYVIWYHPGYSGDFLRSRPAVSLAGEALPSQP